MAQNKINLAQIVVLFSYTHSKQKLDVRLLVFSLSLMSEWICLGLSNQDYVNGWKLGVGHTFNHVLFLNRALDNSQWIDYKKKYCISEIVCCS